MARNPRILVAKPGLDGHDRGAKVIASALRDAGMEVVYTGLRAQVPHIAHAAVQEGVDAIGLSILSGAHLAVCRQLWDELGKLGARDLPVVVGGVIPKADHEALRGLGVKAVFGPETPMSTIVDFFRGLVASGEARESA
jgi:methylmalonyl-CoA mutase C-terminal domain/subunit